MILGGAQRVKMPLERSEGNIILMRFQKGVRTQLGTRLEDNYNLRESGYSHPVSRKLG